ncbi:MAG: helix-turn-helix domain-containing protein [Halanaeroarchaeum sp.]
MDHLEGDIADVELHFPEGECHCDVTVCRESAEGRCVEVFHHSGEICTNCPGMVFGSYDTVPHFLERTADEFVVQTYLSADHQLSELVQDLRAVSESVRVLRIVSNRDDEIGDQTAEVDLSQLTDKQREAMELAVERGYYESPPAVSLGDLAEAFEVSPSAMSQRLSRAEERVMTQLFSP